MNQDGRREVRKVLIITLFLNILVMVIKVVVGTITGSLSLIADALHSVTDSANNILGLITNHFASPEPDREHPYGHLKFDGLGALGIAVFLGIACFEILSSAITRLFKPVETVEVTAVSLAILLIVLAINIFVTIYEKRVGERLGSSILIADARHTLSDVWVTILVIVGLAGVWIGNLMNLPILNWLDVVLSFPVAFMVFKSAGEVLKENLPWLVDEVAIAPETIYDLTMAVPGVINCHDIASRGLVGRQVFIEMHIVVDAQDVATAHQITEDIELKLQEKFYPARISIHIEPPGYQSPHISYDEGESS